jgi:hypothetical protein
MRITQRADDESAILLMAFFHTLPEPTPELFGMEVAKLATSRSHARKMVDAMCRNLDYYPERSAEGAP